GSLSLGLCKLVGDIANADWPDGEYWVFIKLMGRLDCENSLHLDVSELAKEMGRDRTGVSRAISRFVKRVILHRGPRVGRSYTYRLDPSTAWRGKADARSRIQREIDERQWTVHEGGKDAPEQSEKLF